MSHFTKALMLVSVSVLTLSACSGDGKGPGQLGTKSDIVVNNKGMPGAQQQTTTAESGVTSSIENVDPLPPAEVLAGEPVPAPETSQSLPASSPAVDAAVQQVQEAKAAMPASTSAPIVDGTPSSTAPATDVTAADVAASVPVPSADGTPPQLEGTASPEEKSAGAPVTQARVYPAPESTGAPVWPATPEKVPTSEPSAPAVAETPAAPAATPVPSVPSQPGTKGTAYELGMTGTSAAVSDAVATTTAPVTSGTAINLYDPAIIKAAQTALKAKSGYNGAANGQLSTEFLNALSKYQGDNKLAPGGLNLDTLRHLGVAE
jgi:hypothetical protein